MDIPEALTVSSPDDAHESLRLALLDAIAEINDLTTRVTALEEA